MTFEKITDAMLVNKGIQVLPKIPTLTAADLQKKFDELPLEVIIPVFNALVDSLNTALADEVRDNDSEIPTSAAIVDYVSAMGGGDMMRSVYDTNFNGIVDNAERLGGYDTTHYATKNEVLEAKAEISECDKAEVFNTVNEMNAYLRSASNKGKKKVGDILFVKAIGSPAYYITEVLTVSDSTGKYYKIAQIETGVNVPTFTLNGTTLTITNEV